MQNKFHTFVHCKVRIIEKVAQSLFIRHSCHAKNMISLLLLKNVGSQATFLSCKQPINPPLSTYTVHLIMRQSESTVECCLSTFFSNSRTFTTKIIYIATHTKLKLYIYPCFNSSNNIWKERKLEVYPIISTHLRCQQYRRYTNRIKPEKINLRIDLRLQ